MQSVLSRILTRITVSISYDDDHYTTGTSKILADYKHIWRLCISSPDLSNIVEEVSVNISWANHYFHVFKTEFVCFKQGANSTLSGKHLKLID